MEGGFSKVILPHRKKGAVVKGGPFDGFEVVHSYTREEALADGVLVDVTEMAREAGVLHPTAVTQKVWEKYVVVPEGVSCQDEDGRQWDILFMFATAARRHGGAELHYKLYVRNNDHQPMAAHLVTLKAVIGPGDTAEPVITIMCTDED